MSSIYITTGAPNLDNPLLNALLGPAVYDLENISGSITYVLQGKAGSSGYDGYGGTLWSANGAATAFVNAVSAWTAVSNVPIAAYPFYYNGSGGTGANWVEQLDFLGSESTELGHHQLPYKNAMFTMQLEGGFNSQSAVFTRENNAIGGYSFTTFVHEIGHALGLDHPHDGAVFPGVTSESSLGSFGLNQGIFTVMSYNDGYVTKGYSPSYAYGWMSTPGAFDIAATQALYGANSSTHAGDDVYRIPLLNQVGTSYSCLWDAGGVDTLSAEGASIACTIDLREASLLNEAGGGGWLSSGSGIYGGFTIAHDAKIENAIGGEADDIVTGNGLANKILGGGGNDRLSGGLGDDVLLGGDGGDSIDGGLGNDTVNGGAGFDTASYEDATAGVTIDLYILTAQNTVNAGFDTLISIENLLGSSFADDLSGDLADNRINGGAGNDTLHGNAGDDLLTGGEGHDVLDGGAGKDTAVFNYAFADTTVGANSVTSVWLRSAGGVQVDTVSGIEVYKFADGQIDVADGNVLVDDFAYLNGYRDVYRSGADAELHYNNYGWKEGRDPDAQFTTTGYLAANADVRSLGMNPLEHYRNYGFKEGRDPSAGFDSEQYLARNADVAAAGLNPLEHYLNYGQAEGRLAYAAVGRSVVGGFDAEFYLLAYNDVARTGMDPLTHYLTYGFKEGRDPNAYFDTSYYLEHNADVAAAGIDPLAHYWQYGWKEGRDPSAHFDTSAYLAVNGDVGAARINPLEHYLDHGRLEGRVVHDAGWII